jgi:hypothetical protein
MIANLGNNNINPQKKKTKNCKVATEFSLQRAPPGHYPVLRAFSQSRETEVGEWQSKA